MKWAHMEAAGSAPRRAERKARTVSAIENGPPSRKCSSVIGALWPATASDPTKLVTCARRRKSSREDHEEAIA